VERLLREFLNITTTRIIIISVYSSTRDTSASQTSVFVRTIKINNKHNYNHNNNNNNDHRVTLYIRSFKVDCLTLLCMSWDWSWVWHAAVMVKPNRLQGPDFQKNLRKNPKFSASFSQVYVKFIESYKVNIFTEF